jgi:hypothetical protein
MKLSAVRRYLMVVRPGIVCGLIASLALMAAVPALARPASWSGPPVPSRRPTSSPRQSNTSRHSSRGGSPTTSGGNQPTIGRQGRTASRPSTMLSLRSMMTRFTPAV